jgi:hypothetical protein
MLHELSGSKEQKQSYNSCCSALLLAAMHVYAGLQVCAGSNWKTSSMPASGNGSPDHGVPEHSNQLQGVQTQMPLTLPTQHYALRELLARLQNQATWTPQAVERQSHGISEAHLASSGIIRFELIGVGVELPARVPHACVLVVHRR